jgi:outer membrane murein-binding lipoprotein Lpp
MNTKAWIGVALVVAVLAMSGCETLVVDDRSEAVREQTAVDNLRNDVESLRHRMDAMETANQNLFQEIDTLRRSSGGDRAMEDKLVALERDLRAVQAAQQRMKQDVIDDLAPRIANLYKGPSSTGASSTRGGGTASGVEKGYEHVVQPGQSLSQIASAYKVTVDAILKANNLKDPNAIRSGQKLFIPESAGAKARRESRPAE